MSFSGVANTLISEPRLWAVWPVGDVDDLHEVRAPGAREAAIEFVAARERRQCEYQIAAGDACIEVMVAPNDDTSDSAATMWLVEGEAVPSYCARPLKRAQKGPGAE